MKEKYRETTGYSQDREQYLLEREKQLEEREEMLREREQQLSKRNYDPNEVYPVSMKLSGSTMEALDNIKERTGESNRTRIVATAIKFMDLILNDYSDEKNKVTLINKDGNKENLIFSMQ